MIQNLIHLTLAPNIGAAISTRTGGVSLPPFASNNFGLHVGDNPDCVQENRRLLQQSLDRVHAIQWLDQVHGIDVVPASEAPALPKADACFSRERGLACAVMTADCLPVLFYALDGSQVAAAHAGWRGLAGGILLETLNAFPVNCLVGAYLGPAIGQSAFEVGPEVRAAFPWASASCFLAGQGDRYYANLYQLAREQLTKAGVRQIEGGEYCTFTEGERFYSYRRDGQTGRMVSLIWRN